MRKTITVVLLLVASLYYFLWRTQPAQTQTGPAGAIAPTDALLPPTNYSLALNGAGAYAEVPHGESLGLEGPYTVEAWIKTNFIAAQGIVERYNRLGNGEGGFAFRLSHANRLEFYAGNSAAFEMVSGQTVVTPGVWHHVAAVFDGREMRLFLDGTLDGFQPSTFTPTRGAANLRIGAWADSSGGFFNGLIDEVRLTASARYVRNFTTERELSAGGMGAGPDGSWCKGVWGFHGQTAEDASGYDNHALLYGGAGFSAETNYDAAQTTGGAQPSAEVQKWIRFDELPKGAVVNNHYPDVSFIANGGVNVVTYLAVENHGTGSTAPNVIGPGGSAFQVPLIVQFPRPVDGLLFNITGTDDFGTIAQVDIYQNGVYRTTRPIPGKGNAGHTSPTAINVGAEFDNVTKVVVHSITDTRGICYDDFIFSYTPPPPPPPAPPTGLRTVSASATKVDLAWVDNSATESEFRVERCAGVGCFHFTQVARLQQNTTSWRDQSVAVNTTYTYRVLAANAGGVSGYSNSVLASTTLRAPTSLQAEATSAGRIRLRWSYVSTENEGFSLERSSGNSPYTHVANLSRFAVETEDHRLESGTTYNYRIRAYLNGGYSDYSNVATVTMPSCETQPIQVPSGFFGTLGRHGWDVIFKLSDDDGLVATNIALAKQSGATLDVRHLADEISVPYFTLETSRFGKMRGELKVNGDDPVLRSRLVSLQGPIDQGWRFYYEATYAIDRLPNNSTSCLQITQRYEFEKAIPGDHCEPTGTLPCARFRPYVKYDFRGKDGEQLRSINIAQRARYAIDSVPNTTVGLFRDCDYFPVCSVISGGLGFSSVENPLENEIEARVINNGGAGDFDNIHETWAPWVQEPNPNSDNWPPITPGCPECFHSHWRWGYLTYGEGGGSIIALPNGSKQNVDLAVVKYREGEEDPTDYKDLLGPQLESIRRINPSVRVVLTPTGGIPMPVLLDPPTLPVPVVTWLSGTSNARTDTFFEFGGFFNPSFRDKQVEILRRQAGNVPLELESGEEDKPALVVFANLYGEGQVTYVTLDPAEKATLPEDYTLYNNDGFDLGTTAAASGKHTVTFHLPSVSDPALFGKLRVLHAEPDHLHPTRFAWVDRTILSPDAPSPNFSARTLSASTDYLGAFFIGVKSDTPPPAPGTAELALTASRTPGTVASGSTLTYTFDVANHGPNAATDIHFIDGPSPHEVFVSASASQGSCHTEEGSVVCELGSLGVGASASVTVTLRAHDAGIAIPPGGKLIANSAVAVARQSDGNQSNNHVTLGTTMLPDPNPAPTVEIKSHVSGAYINGPANVTLTAEAADNNGSISKVEFYDGEHLLGTASLSGTNLYSLNWHASEFGRHELVAVATDNGGRVAASRPVGVLVNGGAGMRFISPVDGAGFNTPASVLLIAQSGVSGQNIARVDFYAGFYHLGTAPPSSVGHYFLTWADAAPGTYSVTAVATDNAGVQSSSLPINIKISEPATVRLVKPAEGEVFSSSSNIVLQAEAQHDGGTPRKVEFFANGALIGAGVGTGGSQYYLTSNNIPDGTYTLTAVVTDSFGGTVTSAPVNIGVNRRAADPGGFLWFETNLPAGASVHGDRDDWYWVTANPAPFFGMSSHQSKLASGFHQHYFQGATNRLALGAGDRLFTYVFLDPNYMPSEIMLQWHDGGGWEHRAYWGANQIQFGVDQTDSRRYMGPLPVPGRWVRLEVPAATVGLEGRSVNGMSFGLEGGRATWSGAGKLAATAPVPPEPLAGDFVWVDDALPPGAVEENQGGDSWKWVTTDPLPHPNGNSFSHQSDFDGSGVERLRWHGFKGAHNALTVNPGDVLFTHVFIDPNNTPGQIMLQWHDGEGWEHRAYWGSDLAKLGALGTESRRFMGGLPAKRGEWVRLEVPASYVGLEGKTVSGMAFTVVSREGFRSRAAWDMSGKAGRATSVPYPLASITRFWRFVNENQGRNSYMYYSTDFNQRYPGEVAQGSFQCYVYPNQAAGTVPLYRLIHLQTQRYVYIQHPGPLDTGYVRDWSMGDNGIAGYVYPDGVGGTTPLPGTDPLYIFRDTKYDYVFSTDLAEGTGRTSEGIAGYIHKINYPVPVAPSDLKVFVKSGDYYLIWKDNSGNELSFKLERRGIDDQNWAPVSPDLPANTSKYVLGGVSPRGSTLPPPGCYRIRASNLTGDSPHSNETCFNGGGGGGGGKGDQLAESYLELAEDPPELNATPEVTIVAPAGGVVESSGSLIANAFDLDGNGTLGAVEFFLGETKLGEASAAPYVLSWTNAAPGSYTVTAKVTDSRGATATSDPVTLTVNAPPSVRVTSPADASLFHQPTAIVIEASAADADGAVSRVDFYKGDTLIGSDATAPYSFTWANADAGSYGLSVRAVDDRGALTASAPVNVTVNVAPTVDITTPVYGTSFSHGVNIVISASATDADGGISKVEFFQGAFKLGEDFAAPYSYTWQGAGGGTYDLTARATDSRGAVAVSGAVRVTVANPNQPPPVNGASVTELSIPVQLAAGSTHPVTIRLRNTGTTTWTSAAGYSLGTQSPPDNVTWGNTALGAGRVGLPSSVSPNAEVTFTFNIVAPSTPGTYNFQRQLVQQGVEWFGEATQSVAVTVTPPPPPAKASYVRTDTDTQGNWKGVYGTDGYLVANEAAFYPDYARLTISGVPQFTWADSTGDTRALRKASSLTDRIASCWYGQGTFSAELDLTDGQTHRVALYVLDWDNYGPRTQRVEILDAQTGALLDSRTVSDFTQGKYLVWKISGRVRINVVNTGTNAVVSGLFLDTPPYAHWQFDEGSGSMAMDMLSYSSANLSGATWSAGKVGPGSLNFDGVDDRLVVNGTAGLRNIADTFTVAFWAYPRSPHEIDPESTVGYGGTSGQRYAFEPRFKGDPYAGAGISVGTNGVSVYEHAGDYMPALLVHPDTLSGWTHVAVVYDNRRPKLYINGVLARVGLQSPRSAVLLQPQDIGGMVYGFYDGLLDEVRIYDQVLGPGEIRHLAQGQPLKHLAMYKPVTQSSTLVYTPTPTADLAADGNTDGNFYNWSVTHTKSDNQAWWQADLGASVSIQHLSLWNRTDCCASRLSSFYVFVSDQPFTSNDSSVQNQPGVTTYVVSGTGGSPTTIPVNRAGRYVRVQLSGLDYLSLAEVQVWGVPR